MSAYKRWIPSFRALYIHDLQPSYNLLITFLIGYALIIGIDSHACASRVAIFRLCQLTILIQLLELAQALGFIMLPQSSVSAYNLVLITCVWWGGGV